MYPHLQICIIKVLTYTISRIFFLKEDGEKIQEWVPLIENEVILYVNKEFFVNSNTRLTI